MENKIKFGQFYTKKSKYIIGNLIEDLLQKSQHTYHQLKFLI